jgi:hypothetical protein
MECVTERVRGGGLSGRAEMYGGPKETDTLLNVRQDGRIPPTVTHEVFEAPMDTKQ